MTPITGDQALEALRQVVAEKPVGYWYPRNQDCVYVLEDGQPGCIVGHALHKLFPDTWRNIWIVDANEVIDTPYNYDLEDYLDYRAIVALAVAQGVQDAHQPWSEALNAATRAID